MFVNSLCALAFMVFLCELRVKDVDGFSKISNRLNVRSSRNQVRLQTSTTVEPVWPGKPCDCGENSVGCTYNKNDKICTCKYDYVQAPNGTCIEPCYCKNLGMCVKNVCECREGSYGDHCEHIEQCDGYGLANKCGDPLYVECAIRRTGVICLCKDQKLTWDQDTRTCIECNCGPNGICNFEKGKKKCDCFSDFVQAEKGAEMEGMCRPCGCGKNSDLCKFNSTGKFCNCHKGYAQRVDECKECVCGPHATCSFDGWKKVCTCDKGYKMENGECVTCDCGPHGTCSYNDKGDKVCTCNKDSLPYGDTCVECNCGLDGSCKLNSEGKKTCTCDQGFGDREGKCIDCQCYYGERALPCSFTGKVQNCHCPDGSVVQDFFCKPVNF